MLSTHISVSKADGPHSRPQQKGLEAVYIRARGSYQGGLLLRADQGADGKEFRSSDVQIKKAHCRGFNVQLKSHRVINLYAICGRNMAVQL